MAHFMTLADLIGGIGSYSTIRKLLLGKYGGKGGLDSVNSS